jgi:hypothetical protein
MEISASMPVSFSLWWALIQEHRRGSEKLLQVLINIDRRRRGSCFTWWQMGPRAGLDVPVKRKSEPAAFRVNHPTAQPACWSLHDVGRIGRKTLVSVFDARYCRRRYRSWNENRERAVNSVIPCLKQEVLGRTSIAKHIISVNCSWISPAQLFLGQTNSPFYLVRQGTNRKHQSNNCTAVCIQCNGNVFTTTLPSNGRLFWFHYSHFQRHVTLHSKLMGDTTDRDSKMMISAFCFFPK